jgi:hypothetical protein
MRVTTIGQLIDELENYHYETPVKVTHQGVAFYLEDVDLDDEGSLIISTGFNYEEEEVNNG